MEDLLRGRTGNKELIEWARQQLNGKRNAIIVAFLIVILIGFIQVIPFIGALVTFIIEGSLILGLAGMSLAVIRGEEVKPADVFNGFSHLWIAFKTYFFMLLFTILWTLLLIIPGIIAGINYSQSFYILKDNPHMGAREILGKSKQMIYGYRWKYCWFLTRWLLIALQYTLPIIIASLFGMIFFFMMKALAFIGVILIIIGAIATIYLMFVKYYPDFMVSAAAFYEDIRDKAMDERESEKEKVEVNE